MSASSISAIFTSLALCVAVIPASGSENSISSTMTIDLLDRITVTTAVEGVIASVGVREGEPVRKGQTLIQLDTERTKKQLAVAEAEFEALTLRAQNNSREQVNLARERTAQFNVSKLQEVKSRYGVTVPALEMSRAMTELDQARSEVRGARQDMKQFQQEAESRQRQMELLELDIRQSTVASPFDGALTRIDRHAGEFVQPGQAIAELYRLDRLSGAVLVDARDLPPADAVGITGSLVLSGRERMPAFDVVITRVLPRVDVDSRYRAFVEITNRRSESGRWDLLPGMQGEVTLLLGSVNQSYEHDWE